MVVDGLGSDKILAKNFVSLKARESSRAVVRSKNFPNQTIESL